MSFILDALRKSEHARQQSTGPGLAEVPMAPVRPRSNVWAIAAIALLVINLAGAGIWLLARARHENGARADSSAAAAPPATPPPAATGAPVSNGATSTTAAPPPARTDVPPLQEAGEAGRSGGRNPLADEVGPGSVDPTLQAGAASVPSGPPAVTSRRTGATRHPGTVVYAPIPEASDLPYSAPATEPSSTPRESLPTADEVSARGGLAPLHLDLHVYDSQPARRFIFVNSHKYREGDTLAEGPVIEKITPDGAVLSYQGNRFKLTSN